MFTVASLWRHPIKSHGREALDAVTLTKGQTMPFDRRWAVTHEQTKFDSAHPKWEKCRNFMIGAVNPSIAGIWARFDEGRGIMHLQHVQTGEISFDPDDPIDVTRFLNWIAPLTAHIASQPTALVSAGERGMTDTPFPSLTVMNTASHDAVATQLGQALEPERWRGNIWLDGAKPWAEWDWIGQDLRIGTATLRMQERCVRCNHTNANPVTGVRDVDTLGALRDGWDHTDIGVYCEVIESGHIKIGDTAKVL
jgi:uncharacterized protein YcbX